MLINFCKRIVKVGKEGGKGEEVEDDDVFPVGMVFFCMIMYVH